MFRSKFFIFYIEEGIKVNRGKSNVCTRYILHDILSWFFLIIAFFMLFYANFSVIIACNKIRKITLNVKKDLISIH